MSNISGYVEVEVQLPPEDGADQSKPTTSIITVPGESFGLEQGGDWSSDRDDGEWSAGFLFVAFSQYFSLRLSFSMHGLSFQSYQLSIVDATVPVNVIEDALVLDSIHPPRETD